MVWKALTNFSANPISCLQSPEQPRGVLSPAPGVRTRAFRSQQLAQSSLPKQQLALWAGLVTAFVIRLHHEGVMGKVRPEEPRV